jgi:hypothetical protein
MTMTMSRTAVFSALRSRGADRAVVAFSGGGDEGGADSITLYAGEEELSQLSLYTYVGETPRCPVNPDVALADALSDPVNKEYGGFDGDFDVEGEVIWETEGETVMLVKDEREGYEHSEVYL